MTITFDVPNLNHFIPHCQVFFDFFFDFYLDNSFLLFYYAFCLLDIVFFFYLYYPIDEGQNLQVYARW